MTPTDVYLVTTPRFSVVLIAYNQERYVEAAVRSVLKSDFRDLEVVCVDDGSTDSTYSILTELARQDTRVRPSRLEHTGRPGSVRNAALKLVRGEFVCFLDGDDLDDSRRFALLDEAIRRAGPTVDVLFSDYVDFEDGSLPAAGTVRLERNDVGRDLRAVARANWTLDDGVTCYEFDGETLGRFLMLREFVVVTSTICVRSELLRTRGVSFPTDRTVGEDTVVWMRCVLGSRTVFVDTPLSYWRKYPDSLTARRTYSKQVELVRSIHELASLTDSILNDSDRRVLGRKIMREKLDSAFLLEQEGHYWLAFRAYFRAAREDLHILPAIRAIKALVWPSKSLSSTR